MKRRDFLSISLPATGAVLLGQGFMDRKIFREINNQFLGTESFSHYDLVINGAGLGGYFAALEAVSKGKRVLVVEKRTSPGYDIWARRKLWIGQQGTERFDEELNQLFFPEGEKIEVFNGSGKGPNGSLHDDELALFSGSIRKGLVRNLLLHKVHLLLMTDVCGVLTNGKTVTGVVIAGKHGLHTIPCTQFLDASDNLMFTRRLTKDKIQGEKSNFVVELINVDNNKKRKIKAPSLGVIGDEIIIHPGKRDPNQAFLEFSFQIDGDDYSNWENKARFIAADIGTALPGLADGFDKARIHQFAIESTIYLKDKTAPDPELSGYHTFTVDNVDLDGHKILSIQRMAKEVVGGIRFRNNNQESTALRMPGQEIPISELVLTAVDEPGLIIPLKQVSFDYKRHVPIRENCQVLVAGAGTAGAMAAMGAAEKGANTIILDYFNDLGGTKTMGSVMGYYHGVKDNGFFKSHIDEAASLSTETNMNLRSGRILHHLKSLTELNGRVLGSSIICGAIVDSGQVQGVLVCRNGRLETILAQKTIDGTGDGDVAYFAGAAYKFGDDRYGQTQNYSQWDMTGFKNNPSSHSRDYDIIDNTKITDLQRGFFLTHYEAHFYDFNPMLTVRESRRIEGLYELNLIDVVEKTHFEDMISEASSDYDPHHVGVTPYTRCGFLLPHSNVVRLEIPYRCIVPKTLEGLLISGRGFSQTHNALQFTRMTADLIVLGYLTGQIAADQVWKNVGTHEYDLSELQNEWRELGYLPEDFTRRKKGNLNADPQEIKRRIHNLSMGKEEYLYEVVRVPKDKAVPGLKSAFKDGGLSEDGRLLVAKALAWFGESEGNDLIEEELKVMFEEEMADGYPDGYVDNYDFIRGREKNVLEGLFWKINQNIALLGMASNSACKNTIKHILENTRSGGGMVMRDSEYYNGRIDLKIVPFHNRILNLAFYAERVPDPVFIKGFEELLKDENVGGFKTTEYQKVRWRVFGATLELSVAAAMARCGSRAGYLLLTDYLEDIHYLFKKFAAEELQSITKMNYGYDSKRWLGQIDRLSFPASPKKLVADEVEV